MLQRDRPAWNRSALFGLIPLVLFILWAMYRDRLPNVPDSAWLGAYVILAAAIIALSVRAVGKRRKELEQVARELGLEFSAAGDERSLRAFFEPVDPTGEQRDLENVMKARRDLEQSELRRLSLLQQVDHPIARNVMAGPLAGADGVVFDYSYQTRSINPGSSTTVGQTVAAFRFRGCRFPSFEISPQDVVDRVTTAMAGPPDLLADHPEVAKRFRLRCEDAKAVRELLAGGVLRVFETLGDDFQEHVEGVDECIVVYRPGRKVRSELMKAFVANAAAVAAAFGRCRG